MAVKMKVTYLDGRTEVVLASPRAQVMAEEKFGGISDATRLRASYYLAWAALHKSGREAADYETWIDTISEVADVEEAPGDADPTPAAPPTTTSLDSPSPAV